MEFIRPSESNVTVPLLRIEGVWKAFPGVQALRGVDLSVRAGSVHALIGENGAGKSTLIKFLGGVHQPDRGTILIDGVPQRFLNPRMARRAGVGIIYQEFNLVPGLTAWENIFLGREQAWGGWIRRRREQDLAGQLLARLGVDVPLNVPCKDLSVAQQQVVEIAKALSQNVRLLVMDEPTTTLTPIEVQQLLILIGELRAHGLGIIYISHRLDEIQSVADEATVLRDGQHVGTLSRDQFDRQRIIEMMVGRQIEDEFPKVAAAIGEPRLEVQQLRRSPKVNEVSFVVRAGEVLGITGLVGAGRTETARVIFGADRADGGTIMVDGVIRTIRSPRYAIAAGICLLTEDRKQQGLMLDLSVRENFGLPNLRQFARVGFVNRDKERRALSGYIDSLQIKIADQDVRVKNLSGGNQQKVVLAKWLQADADILIFDEPTRGIDVGAKYEIYLLINRLAAAGKAILLISSELPEVLGMSDRVIVMHDGRITGEITNPQLATPEQVMELAIN